MLRSIVWCVTVALLGQAAAPMPAAVRLTGSQFAYRTVAGDTLASIAARKVNARDGVAVDVSVPR